MALQGKMAAARIESAWPISANSIGVLLRNDNELFVVQAFLGTKKTELIVESPEESALTFTLLSLDGSIEVIGDSAGLRRVGGVDDKQLSSGGACRFVALSPAGDKAICSGPEADGVSIIDLSSVSVLECPVRFKGGAWSIAYR
ncbi:MAG: hypothetical protein KDD65_07455, partial [Bacteroidetes bacterium]|nr:hypothetical protein [Bacteroidota bacterium]